MKKYLIFFSTTLLFLSCLPIYLQAEQQITISNNCHDESINLQAISIEYNNHNLPEEHKNLGILGKDKRTEFTIKGPAYVDISGPVPCQVDTKEKKIINVKYDDSNGHGTCRCNKGGIGNTIN